MKQDLSITEVKEPVGRWCQSGHLPAETFILDGNKIPMRFFHIIGLGINGIYCESCLTVANQLARKLKERK